MSREPGLGAHRGKRKLWPIAAGAAILLLAGFAALAMYWDNANLKYHDRVRDAIYGSGNVRDAVSAYYEDNKALPVNRQALLAPVKRAPYLAAWPSLLEYSVELKDGIVLITFAPGPEPIAGRTVTFRPVPSKAVIEWDCRTSVAEAHRPYFCKQRE
jgi:hypothetical protein